MWIIKNQYNTRFELHTKEDCEEFTREWSIHGETFTKPVDNGMPCPLKLCDKVYVREKK